MGTSGGSTAGDTQPKIDIEVDTREKTFHWLWLRINGGEKRLVFFAKSKAEAKRQQAAIELAYLFGRADAQKEAAQ